MKLGRLEITHWEYPDPKMTKKFIYFEYEKACCGCTFLTILNIAFILNSKQYIKDSIEDQENT